jgi:hypothetical protein
MDYRQPSMWKSDLAKKNAFGVLNWMRKPNVVKQPIPAITNSSQDSPMARLPDNYIMNERTGAVTEIPSRGYVPQEENSVAQPKSLKKIPVIIPKLRGDGLWDTMANYANDLSAAATASEINSARKDEFNANLEAQKQQRANRVSEANEASSRVNTLSTLQKIQMEQQAAEAAQKPKQYQTPTNLISDIVRERMKSGIEGYDPAADFGNMDNQFRQQFSNGQYRQRLAADLSSAQGDSQKISQAIQNAKSRGVPQSVIDELMNQ